MTDIMLDIESMDTKTTAVILSIGAVKFEPRGGIVDRFIINITPKSCVEAGLTVGIDTVMWWMKQSDEARNALVKGAVSLDVALHTFAEWLGSDVKGIWGNGASFDNAIVANAYKAAKIPLPWKYTQDMCYRTIKNMFPHIKLNRIGTHHNAVDDAESQALHLIEILANFKK